MSLSDALDVDSEGNGLSVMDVVATEEDLADALGSRELCGKLRSCIAQVLDERETQIIFLRYGLDGKAPRTQRETAKLCGISRSYVSRRR